MSAKLSNMEANQDWIVLDMKQVRLKSRTRPVGYIEEVTAAGVLIEGDRLALRKNVYHNLRRRFQKTEARLQEPSLVDLSTRFVKSLASWAAAGFAVVSPETYAQRMGTCRRCDLWDEHARGGLGKCGSPKCGCTRLKQWLATELCPEGKWH